MDKTLVDAFEESLECAIESGRIDVKAQSAPINAGRRLVAIIDANPEKATNVLFPTLLKYMDALGMLANNEQPNNASKPSPTNNLVAFRNRSKVANG